MTNKDEFNKNFGLFVKQLRVERNWKQTHLADLMDNNFQNISRLERGEVSSTLYWCSKLAKAFSMTLSELMTNFERYKR